MPRAASDVISALWLAWLAYWVFASRDVKATRWRDSPASQLLYRGPSIAAALLLMGFPSRPAWLDERIVPASIPLLSAAMTLVAAGLGFAAWARLHLGRNWSAVVTVKEQHALVTTGPYRIARHPIYTGVLLALLGTALAVGRWRAVLAVAIALFGFAMKIPIEERRMRELFPEYDQYRRRVRAIIPYVI